MRFKYKFKHYYFNKYFLSLFAQDRYYISYDYKHKAIWYRNAKVATRTIHNVLKEQGQSGSYVYGSEASIDIDKFSDYFKFAFVRNPESRFLSGWKDKVVQNNYFKFSPEQHLRMQTMTEFLTYLSDQDPINIDKHFKGQHLLIEKEKLDFLGRFENFENDFTFVLEKIGLSRIKIPHKNKTASKTYKTNNEEKRLIQEIYKEDYMFFYPNES